MKGRRSNPSHRNASEAAVSRWLSEFQRGNQYETSLNGSKVPTADKSACGC